MIIIVPTFNQFQAESKPFKVTTALYKSICGDYWVQVEDCYGSNELTEKKTIDGIKFKLWKYKDWHGEWTEYLNRQLIF